MMECKHCGTVDPNEQATVQLNGQEVRQCKACKRFTPVDWKSIEVGDTVECIEDVGTELVRGVRYRVAGFRDNRDYVILEGLGEHWYFLRRFRKIVTPESLTLEQEYTDDHAGEVTATQYMISNVCDEIKSLLLNKNRKYGDSAIHPLRLFSKASPIEQINVRLDDKISRKMSDQKDEDEDIEMDIIGYLVLKIVAKRILEVEEDNKDGTND